MSDIWFTEYADELACLLADARACAEACESHLIALRSDGDALRSAVDLLAAPAAVAGVLIELIDHPPQLVLAAAGLCRDTATTAADALGDSAPDLVPALRTVAESAGALLDAAR